MNSDHKNELVLRLLDGDLSPAQQQELEQLLLSDPETREIYLDYIMLDRLLEKDQAVTIHSLNDLEQKPARLAPIFWYSAACFLILLAAAFFIHTSAQPPSAGLQFAQNTSFSIEGSKSDNRLEVGQQLTVDYGAVELKLPRNVTATVIGPAVLRIRDEQTLLLDKGKASFQVSEDGVGFQVITPRLKAIDMGTEFTVISSWRDYDELHVKTGEVIVSPLFGGGRSIVTKEACAIDDNRSLKPIDYADDSFQADLPEQVDLLFEDPFASYRIPDGNISEQFPPSLTIDGKSLTLGIYNPAGTGRWYDHPALNDRSASSGEAPFMNSPNLGFLVTSSQASIERKIDHIKANCLYAVGLTIGVRIEKLNQRYLSDYEIALVSGETILASETRKSTHCAPNDFARINISWDSSKLPAGVESGAPISLRISARASKKGNAYLDFCNLKASRLRQSSE